MNGDEYKFLLESSDKNSSQRVISSLTQAKAREQASSQIVALLKTRNRVAISEVCAILTRRNLPNAFEDGLRYVENAIVSDQVDGVIDGREFVRRGSWSQPPEASPDPWEVLGVPRNAPKATIKTKYHSLMLELHPDKLPQGATSAQKKLIVDKVSEIIGAYERLKKEGFA